MAYAILHPEYYLCSWTNIPFAAMNFFKPQNPIFLTSKEFDVLLQADGQHWLAEDDTFLSLVSSKLLVACPKGNSSLAPYQKYQVFDNYYINDAVIEITYRCNMNCKHCFNYPDLNPMTQELSIDEIALILGNLLECGVRRINLIGGEPLLHRDFLHILDLLSERQMMLTGVYTNGILIDNKLLDELDKHNLHPKFFISFDGLGYHDSLRGFPGAEGIVLRAIQLCIDRGFAVTVNANVNCDNADCIVGTLDTLDNMGVSCTYLARTSESPRWLLNHGKSMGLKDFYDFSLKTLKNYIDKQRRMNIVVTQVCALDVMNHQFFLPPIQGCRNGNCDRPVCIDARERISITADGQVIPCLPISGIMNKIGLKFDNILQKSLKDIFKSGNYATWMSMRVMKHIQHNDKCKNCRYSFLCLGGCPIFSFIAPDHFGDYWGPDPWKCVFFEERYAQKFADALDGYFCINKGIEDAIELYK